MANYEEKDQTNLADFEAIRISTASPEDILDWSYGEVLKPETINYRTQKPERDGLFCEKIFGPTKDWECYCGKYKKVRYKGVVCDKCGVEVTRSSVRRVRMGHIDLSVPVAHIWYTKGSSSVVSLVLSISGADIEKICYFASYAILEVNEELRQSSLESLEKEYKEYQSENAQAEATKKAEVEAIYKSTKSELLGLKRGTIISEQIFRDLSERYGQIVKVGIGAEAILDLLKAVNLEEEIRKIQEDAKGQIGLSKVKLLKRMRVLQNMQKAGIDPSWLILKRLPVIPPDLRPMVQLDGGRFAASDLNDLYRRVINRNNRLKRLISQGAPEVISRNEKRMLQEAVDALIDNSARKDKIAATTGGKRKLKSLSDMLRGKQGRFRQNLLGKRVDYSGRSVIVVGPNLKLHQCGLPKVMAMELFKPFVIGRLISEGYVHNVKNASRLIDKAESFVWDILEDIIKDKFVLLNRAPTLHRLGIQAFQPVLIEGKAIQIHPLVCSAFNADFDGDQMAVHLPLSDKAQEEAREIMLSSKNLLKPASGEPVLSTSYDIILGVFFITTINEGAKGQGLIFSSTNKAITAYNLDEVDLRAQIKVRKDSEIIETTVGRIIFNEILPNEMSYINDQLDKKAVGKLVNKIYHLYGSETTAKFVDDLKDLGFKYAQRAGYTFAASDIHIPKAKDEIIKKTTSEIATINKHYQRGLISDEERYSKSIELWMGAQEMIERAMVDEYPKDNDLNIIMGSGARGKVSQMTQVAGMKGLVADPTGAIIELPITSNFKEGLSVFEYFVASHGSRKGRADTALRTSEAGYLTRRLVDVSQDVVVMATDCGTSKTRTLTKEYYKSFGETWDKYILGRFLGKDVAKIKAGTLITEKEVASINESNVEAIEIYSLLNCEAERGICQKCYGADLATGKPVEIGTAVGIIAAQAIGEPGTQLTMRTFHTGGAAGEDITSGLPRVEEIFEARTPKKPAILSEIDGKVEIKTKDNVYHIKVYGNVKNTEVIEIPDDYNFIIKDGDRVTAKQIIADVKDSTDNKKPIRSKYTGIAKISNNTVSLSVDAAGEVEYMTPKSTTLLVKNGEEVKKGQALTEGHYDLSQGLKLLGKDAILQYIIRQVQLIYETQGQDINDKHIEVIIRMMSSKVKVMSSGDSQYLPGQIVSRFEFDAKNTKLKKENKKMANAMDILLGITRVALKTDSFLSAASFQETTSILIDAAISGKVDHLKGLKENVIIGKLIPAGTGLKKEVE